MDYKFLHKVLDQIVSETRIDYDRKVIETPFPLPRFSFPTFPSFPILQPHPPFSLLKHCKEVYGLNKQEIEYVWEEYREIIKDKINNGI